MITNKHNIDPNTKDKSLEKYKLAVCKVQRREIHNNVYTSNTEFVEIDLDNPEGFVHPSADIAIFIDSGADDGSAAFTFGWGGVGLPVQVTRHSGHIGPLGLAPQGSGLRGASHIFGNTGPLL